MKSNGKKLEALVAFVEETLLPEGFEVKTNQHVCDEDGVPIAEFDITASGKIGTTDFRWLIECRDRPSRGPAPGFWIEQLVTRRRRFGFDKVTAVSTTGFAAGAIACARQYGIELRTVKDLMPDDFRWLVSGGDMTFTRHLTLVEGAMLLIDEEEGQERRDALSAALSALPKDAAFLKSTTTGELVTAAMAFHGAVNSTELLFEGIEPNGPGRKIRLYGKYPAEDHFVVETTAGMVPVRAIDFTGELRIEQMPMPVVTSQRYEYSENCNTISQLAAFAPQEINGQQYALELHRMGEDGETHVILRRMD